MIPRTVLLCAAMAAFPAGGALAATGTLDTGALTPQTAGSRQAAMRDNTGSTARTQGGEVAAPVRPQATPRHGVDVNAGPAGNARPTQ